MAQHITSSNSNMEKLKKIASDITNEQSKSITSNIVMSQEDANLNITSSEDVATIVSAQEAVPMPINKLVNDVTNVKIDTVSVMGYILPTQTFYLLLVLIIVGVLIWYMSGSPKKYKKNQDDN
jgi:hypothetical protein